MTPYYQTNLGTLYQGDCLEVLKEIEDNSVDLILTDPPYILEERSSYGKNKLAKSLVKHRKELDEKDLINGCDNWYKELDNLQKHRNIYIWCSRMQVIEYQNYFAIDKELNYDILIWNKPNAFPTFNNSYIPDKEYCLFFREKGSHIKIENYENAKTIFHQPINQKDKQTWKHPTIKPLNIIETLIKNSTKEGDVVLDMFMGSGTVALACERANRKWIGIEIDEEYCKLIKERLEQETNQGKLDI